MRHPVRPAYFDAVNVIGEVAMAHAFGATSVMLPPELSGPGNASG
jgi:hypothetical protein